jgi:epi-isozizaene 5-monooxygenase
LWEALEDLIGKGVATSNGALHRQHRRTIQPAFHPERVAGYAEMMAAEAGAMVGRWRPGQVIDVFQQMFDFATRTVLRSMLGTHSTGRVADEISTSLRTLFSGMYRRMILPASPLYRLPTPATHRFDRALATIHRVVDDIICARRARDTSSDDLLTALFEARTGTGEPLTRSGDPRRCHLRARGRHRDRGIDPRLDLPAAVPTPARGSAAAPRGGCRGA